MFVTDSSTMRAIDAAAIAGGVAGSTLMERAGLGAARQLIDRPAWLWGCTLVVCGWGNNGGDGLVVARLLHGEGHDVEVLLLADPERFEGDAALNLRRARDAGVSLRVVAEDAAAEILARGVERPGRLIVDGVLGTGFHPPLRGRLLSVVEAINGCGRRVLALDCPSGLDASTGAVEPVAVRADLTTTFGFAKWGLFLRPGRAHCGRVERVDLEFPRSVVETILAEAGDSGLYVDATLAAGWYRPRPIDAHKYSVGSLLAVGGSTGMSGAMTLACLGALRGGAGLVEAVVPGSQRASVDAACIEVLVHGVTETPEGGLDASTRDEISSKSQRHSAALIGPGAGADLTTAQLMVELCAQLTKPTVVDADALNAFGRLQQPPRFPAGSVVTPHTGELARLLSAEPELIENSRRDVLAEAAARLGVVVLHKGAPTMVAAPDGAMAVIAPGGANLASAGSGDVLAGAIAAQLAAGQPPFEAACLGAWLHGRAGDRCAMRVGSDGLLARDLLDELGPATRELEEAHR